MLNECSLQRCYCDCEYLLGTRAKVNPSSFFFFGPPSTSNCSSTILIYDSGYQLEFLISNITSLSWSSIYLSLAIEYEIGPNSEYDPLAIMICDTARKRMKVYIAYHHRIEYHVFLN